MLIANRKNHLLAAGSIGPLVLLCLAAGCQTTKPATPAAGTPAVQLTPYTAPDRAWTLESWDGFLIPKPFSTIVIGW